MLRLKLNHINTEAGEDVSIYFCMVNHTWTVRVYKCPYCILATIEFSSISSVMISFTPTLQMTRPWVNTHTFYLRNACIIAMGSDSYSAHDEIMSYWKEIRFMKMSIFTTTLVFYNCFKILKDISRRWHTALPNSFSWRLTYIIFTDFKGRKSLGLIKWLLLRIFDQAEPP